MGKFSGCILASDVDGTLLSNGVLPKRNIEAIARFVKDGGVFSLATGRSAAAINPVLRLIGKYAGPSVVVNGAMIYDSDKKEILMQKELSNETRKLLLSSIKEFDKIGIEMHCETDVFNLRRTEGTDIHQEYEEIVSLSDNLEAFLNRKWTKALLIARDFDYLGSYAEYLKKFIVGDKLVKTNAEINGFKWQYYEVLPKGVSKASALKELCKILKIKKGSFFAVGDFYNDIEMLREADISACPKNSPEEVKNCCKFIGSRVEDGTVADFIEYLYNG